MRRGKTPGFKEGFRPGVSLRVFIFRQRVFQRLGAPGAVPISAERLISADRFLRQALVLKGAGRRIVPLQDFFRQGGKALGAVPVEADAGIDGPGFFKGPGFLKTPRLII